MSGKLVVKVVSVGNFPVLTKFLLVLAAKSSVFLNPLKLNIIAGTESNMEEDNCSDESVIGGKCMTSILSTEELNNILVGGIPENTEEFETNHKKEMTLKSQNGARNHLFVLQFAAEWCGLCKSIQPLVHVSS